MARTFVPGAIGPLEQETLGYNAQATWTLVFFLEP